MNGFKQLIDTLAGLGADEDDGGIGHEAEVLLQLFAHGVHRVAVLLDSVPLVDGDDAGLTLLVGIARDLGVLLGKATVASIMMTQTRLRSTAARLRRTL